MLGAMSRTMVALAALIAGCSPSQSAAGTVKAAPPIPANIVPYPVVADIDFAESPTFDSQGNLYFANYIRNGTIGRKAPDGTVSIWVETGGQANGLKIDAEGHVIAADSKGKRILRISPDGKHIAVLADRYEGQPFLGPNDVALDKAGNIYFSDPTGSTRDEPIGAVYKIEKDGRVRRLATGLAFPNGLAVSPDQKRLFVAESKLFRVLSFDLAPDGTLNNKKVVYQITSEPDGMEFDEYGRLWIAVFGDGTVDVIQQNGKLLAKIPAGGTGVTNLCFWEGDAYVSVSGQHGIHRLRLSGD